MGHAFLDLGHLLVRLLYANISKRQFLKGARGVPRAPYLGTPNSELTFTLRDDCDLAEPEEVRGAALAMVLDVV
jgi:hypothetical protein